MLGRHSLLLRSQMGPFSCGQEPAFKPYQCWMDWERGDERKRGLELRDLEKASFENTKKNSGKKTQKAGSWSGEIEKTHSEDEGFKKQKRGLGILMEWTSASAGGLFMDRREEV